MISKILHFKKPKDTECDHLTLSLYRQLNDDDECIDGVLLIAWHNEESIVQTDFFPMRIRDGKRFIKDYTTDSAISYVEDFNL